VGDAVPFPGACIEKDFAWAPAHPIVDAYRAYRPMPYDAPSYDLAALHFAVHPDSGFFQLSEAGSITVADDGRMNFTPGAGSVRALRADPAQSEKAIAKFVELASAKPVAPPQRFRPTGANAVQNKTDETKPALKKQD
jgi:hypothetical protein